MTHPRMRGAFAGDFTRIGLRREIIRSKPFLCALYTDWYRALIAQLPAGEGAVLELGSGAGFLAEQLPEIITSELFFCEGVRLVADGQQLPLADASLRGIVMTDVLHHIPQPRLFLREAARCVRPGGVVAMVEPWVTAWSKLIYHNLHHEPFHPETSAWEIPADAGANGALPWILFARDRDRFEKEFPEWEIRTVEPCMPLSYLLSGGLSMRGLMPGWSYPLWRNIERPLGRAAGMFAIIVLVRRNRL